MADLHAWLVTMIIVSSCHRICTITITITLLLLIIIIINNVPTTSIITYLSSSIRPIHSQEGMD